MSNPPSHQRQIGFTAAAAIRPASPSIMCFPQFARVPFSDAPGDGGRERKHYARTRIRGHRRRLRLICGAGYARNLGPYRGARTDTVTPELRLRTGATSNRYAWFEVHPDPRAQFREHPTRNPENLP